MTRIVLSPLGIAVLAIVLLLQTGTSAGQVRRFSPPVDAADLSAILARFADGLAGFVAGLRFFEE